MLRWKMSARYMRQTVSSFIIHFRMCNCFVCVDPSRGAPMQNDTTCNYDYKLVVSTTLVAHPCRPHKGPRVKGQTRQRTSKDPKRPHKGFSRALGLNICITEVPIFTHAGVMDLDSWLGAESGHGSKALRVHPGKSRIPRALEDDIRDDGTPSAVSCNHREA